jgi:hypothetical protein
MLAAAAAIDVLLLFIPSWIVATMSAACRACNGGVGMSCFQQQQHAVGPAEHLWFTTSRTLYVEYGSCWWWSNITGLLLKQQ